MFRRTVSARVNYECSGRFEHSKLVDVCTFKGEIASDFIIQNLLLDKFLRKSLGLTLQIISKYHGHGIDI